MKPSAHILLSAGLSLGIYGIKGDAAGAASCFVTGAFLDIDHVYDCTVNFGVSEYRMWLKTQEKKLKYLCVLLHGWEYVVLLAVLTIYYDKPLIAYIFVGYLSHIVPDAMFNPIRSLLSYSLFYRLMHRFDPHFFFSEAVLVDREASVFHV